MTAKGESLSTTGPNAAQWKGHRFGSNYAAAGNILAGPQVVDAFGDSFEATAGHGLPLAERLLRALEAADAAGGDARGRQGAALKVYRKDAGFAGTDLLVDLARRRQRRSRSPIYGGLWTEWKFHHLYGLGYQPIEQSQGSDVTQVQQHLSALGYLRRAHRTVFDEKGEPRGIFNDATAAAVVRWKKASGLDAGPSLVPFMLRQLEGGAQGHVGGAKPHEAQSITHWSTTPPRCSWQRRPLAQEAPREDDLMSSMSIVGFDPVDRRRRHRDGLALLRRGADCHACPRRRRRDRHDGRCAV